MGRRSSHTPAELRRLITQSSCDLLDKSGLDSLSARSIAKQIGYSPGTLYNVFKNLDDLLLTIQNDLATEMIVALHAVPAAGNNESYLTALGSRYIGFALDNARRWALLFRPQRDIPGSSDPSLNDSCREMLDLFTAAVSRLAPSAPEDEVRRTAKTLWSAIHGISGLAVTEGRAVLSHDEARSHVALLLGTFIHGLTARARAAAE